MKSKRITIQEVARRAGVSASTVSNAMNGRTDRMKPETKARVDAIIASLNYTPNQIARQLKTGHAPVIGLIVPSVANPFWGAVARAMEEAAFTRGYQILLGNSDRDLRRDLRYGELLWAYGVRGLILGSSLISLEHLRELTTLGLQIVLFDRRAQPDDPVAVDSVAVDSLRGARLAVEHLVALGHRRIAFISGPIRTVSRLERLAGYQAALARAGIRFEPSLIWDESVSGTFGDAEGIDLGQWAARELLSRPNRPTALFAINDFYALGAYAGAAEVGLAVPDAVSIVGFDDIVLARSARPALTTVRQPLAAMARAAIDLLVDRLDGEITGEAHCRELAPELIVRASSAAPRPTPVTTGRAGGDGAAAIPGQPAAPLVKKRVVSDAR